MDIKNRRFFYFSADAPREGLPAECRFIKALENKDGRDAALIKCENDVQGFRSRLLVIVPRDLNDRILTGGEKTVVFVYSLNGEKYVDADFIELKEEHGRAMDIGAITIDAGELEKWGYSLGRR